MREDHVNRWIPFREVDPSSLKDARLEAHHAVQWLAKMARAFCAPEADDSHTSLTWVAEEAVLATRNLAPDFSAAVRLKDLSLVMQSGDERTWFPLIGHTEFEVGEWITQELSSRGMNPALLQSPQPYTLALHPLDQGQPYGKVSSTAYEELSALYHNAANLLEYVRSSQQGASPVRCWPHHFDIASLIALDSSEGEKARSIGVGCSPGDDSFPEPYFYLSPWPYPPQTTQLPPVIPPAFWHREGFTAIILRVQEIRSFEPIDLQEIQTQSILDQGILVNRELHLLT